MENSKINKKNILAMLPNSSVGENQNQSYNGYAVRWKLIALNLILFRTSQQKGK